jgi:uncharacterized protein YbaP (TraB family)
MARYIAFVVSILMSSISFAGDSYPADSNFWRAEKDGRVIYILGVTHIGVVAQYPIAPAITDALKASEIYITESALLSLDRERLRQRLKAIYSPDNGGTLSELLKSAECQQSALPHEINKKLLKLYDKQFVKNILSFSPRALFHQLASTAAPLSGELTGEYRLAPSLEWSLDQLAKNSRIPRGYLDDEYWDGFENMDKQTKCELLSGLLNFANTKDAQIRINQQIRNTTVAWIKNSSDEMLQAYYETYGEVFITPDNPLMLWVSNRNHRMCQLLDLGSERTKFVAIGAAHLSGNNGVIQILKRDGYELRAISIRKNN